MWSRTSTQLWRVSALLLAYLLLGSCSSVDVVRLQPDLIQVPKGMEPLAGIQATCLGFYLFSLGLPDADLEKAVNELLMTEARKIGADKVMDLRFEATPGQGIWWLIKLLGFRSATAWGVAIKAEPDSTEEGDVPPPPLALPPSPQSTSGSGPTSPLAPASQASQ